MEQTLLQYIGVAGPATIITAYTAYKVFAYHIERQNYFDQVIASKDQQEQIEREKFLQSLKEISALNSQSMEIQKKTSEGLDAILSSTKTIEAKTDTLYGRVEGFIQFATPQQKGKTKK